MNVALAQKRQSGAATADASRATAGKRFFDNATSCWMVKVFPGEFYVTRQPDEMLVTVLGSCVSACIRDPVAGVGGMNHFMLAKGHSGGWGDELQSARFGNFAMEKLINELIKAGCSRSRMEIKVFGGGNVIEASTQVGTSNSEFVLKYLEAEGLRCAAEDLGGPYPRRIHYSPATGRVVRRLLGTSETYAISREEREYADRLQQRQPAGEIHLFTE
jgi:chemotaxis protein CheD